MAYDIAKLCFFDFETKAEAKLPRVGTYRYASTADAIILTYGLGEKPVRIVQKQGRALAWADLPGEFRDAYEDPSIKFVAWNAGFDRCIWNYSLLDSPLLAPARVLDAMAQAMASNLPAALDQASAALGGPGKQSDGKKLIGMFSLAGAKDPKDYPAEWDRFCSYAARDVAVMRDIWRQTRPLPEKEWRTYWANEAICERGIGIDLEFCRAAAKLAAEDRIRAGKRLAQLTQGSINSIYQHIGLAEWIYARLPDEASKLIMTLSVPEPDERDENDELVPAEITIRRGVVERLLDWMDATGHDDPVLQEVLRLREFGASSATRKFDAALAQESNGRLRGQIVFNGAAQTGRFSGKGVQPQNLTRSPLGGDYGIWEPGAVDMIVDGCSLDDLAVYGDGEVPSRKLALLVRPAIVAPEGRTLIKADYEQVEARALPWLSKDPAADSLLDYFRAVDADPSLPDLYVISASKMLKKPTEEISKAERQRGKISVLACGFGGSKGALASMAANFRMYIPPEDAQEIVNQWREANPWAPAFWAGLMTAARDACNHPGKAKGAGRIGFIFEPSYLGGTLLMRLPSGRALVYPWCRVRNYDIRDKRTGKVKETRRGLTFRRPDGFRSIYGGLLAENATQATCADLLREALVVLHEGLLGAKLDVVLHAHDEIVAECDDNPKAIAQALATLEKSMTMDRHWAEGLPLSVESTVRFYYSAARIKEAA